MARMKKSLFASVLLVLGVPACGGKESGGGSGAGGGSVSCLAKYASKLDGMLTEKRLREVVDPGDKEVKSSVTDMGGLKSISWSWDSERTRKMQMGAMEMELPVSNQVSVSGIRVLDGQKHGPKDGKSYVEQNYRSISKEEMQRIHEQMARSIQERVDKGEITAEQAKLAGGLGEGLAGDERVVETIDGVGDACRWVAKDRTLAVGHGNVFFSLFVDVSADVEVNREKALVLAKLILAECD